MTKLFPYLQLHSDLISFIVKDYVMVRRNATIDHKKICIVFALVLALFPQYALTATYYVSTTGNDVTGNGSVANPWRTLKYAASNVMSGQGHLIRVGAGTFVENGPVEIPLGVNLEGAGVDQTIFKGSSLFYYYPANPGSSPGKFLLTLSGFNPANGNQTLSDFTIDGDSKKLHGGIYVRYRSHVVIENVNVQNTNYCGVWLLDVKDSNMKNIHLLNCSWGSTAYSVGALNLGNLERVEIEQLDIDENTGYGIKAMGPGGYNNIFQLKIHDSHISVNPTGLWNNGSAPNIAIELWQVNLVGCEIYNSYVDNTISLVNSDAIPSTGIQTIRVHHNILDMETRAQGSGYGVELTVHDAEIDHNYFLKGTCGIANWDNPMRNWQIHHNVFYGLQAVYPGEILRSQWSGLHQVKFYNNTIEFTGSETMNVIGLYGGTSDNLEMRNNLIINSTTGYSHYPNELIHTENGASITNLKILNNAIGNLDPGSFLESILEVILGILVPTPDINLNNPSNPSVNKTGNRPAPYYFPAIGSSLIDSGTDVGLPYSGLAPDIGALEFGSTPVPNSTPRISLTNPAWGTSIPSGSSLLLKANASDSDGTISKVEFFRGSTKLGEDLTNPYSFAWANVQPGSHTLTAKATDNHGSVSTSTEINVTVISPNQGPSVSITSPSNNATIPAGSSLTLAASASDSDGTISKVEFFRGVNKLGEDLTAPYNFTWVNVPAGNHALTAKATDNQGAGATSSVVNIAVTTPNHPPSAVITSPSTNETFTEGSTVVISASASDSDGTITKVEFYSGSVKLGEDLTPPYQFEWKNVPAGNHSLKVTSTDNQDAKTTSPPIAISVVKKNQAPIVEIISPMNNETLVPGTITISVSATDSDGTISVVEFYNGEVRLGEDLISPYAFAWEDVPAGNYEITAKAMDNQGAVTLSTPVALTVTHLDAYNFQLYPNPARDRFAVRYYSTTAIQTGQVIIRDTHSRLISTKTALIKVGSNEIAVETTSIATGIYIVTLQLSDGQKFSARLIIQQQ